MDWDREKLKDIPAKGGLIDSSDERMESYREDTMVRGEPDALMLARDESDVAEALGFCDAAGIPVTFCASQTSMTGASVATEGLLISTEKLEGVESISEGGDGPVAVVRPGTVCAEFQAAAAEAGFYYPVAPTSRDDCRMGGNIATNATGEDSYKYGPVRRYVRRLELILPDGTRRTLERKSGCDISLDRNRAGYFTEWQDPIDLIIGSEGTLAFVAKAEIALLPGGPPKLFSALIPVRDNQAALDLVISIASGEMGLAPRTLELIDTSALRLMKTAQGFPKIPDDVGAFIYVKQEYANDAGRDRLLEQWYEKLVPVCGDLIDQLIVGLTRDEQERIRLWRHRIPEAANEWGRSYWPNGGGKVGSDWWVPMPRLREMMAFFYEAANASGLPYMGYAHIGAGHPHTNILAKDPREKDIACDVLLACCRKAVELGGGVAGEHGIGKLHADQLPIQHDAKTIDTMKKWKREYDPNWILGRGNIFEI